VFRSWGEEVWDGVSRDLRRTYPTSVEQLRIVQYDSCRGLEGWTVINLAVDDFYEYKRRSWKPPEDLPPGVYPDDPKLAAQFAARWMLIPLTRGIDTLVLQIGSASSAVGQALGDLVPKCGDFLEWIKR
jgi:hypothetical protein